MNIFGGRPGIAAGVLAVVAILTAAFCVPALSISLLIGSFAFILLCILLFACRFISGYRLFADMLIVAVFIAALLRGIDTFDRRASAASDVCGDDAYIQAIANERISSGDYYTQYTVTILSVNGIECSESAEFICEYNSELQAGYEFVLRHALVEYTPELEKSEAQDLIADGIFLRITASNVEDYAILSEGNFSRIDELKKVNSYLSAKLRNGVGGEEGKLAAAMLLGDRSALTARIYRDFSRSGLSHYLAVSGLHVSIITGVVAFLIGRLRIKRTIRDLITAAFAICYLFLLGFPVSAVRAVIMMLMVSAAYSLGDISDSVNSLGIAAAFIVIVDPFAVFDKSFILSFCATLGIVCFLPLFNDLVGKILRKLKGKGEEKKSIKLLRKSINLILGTLLGTASALSTTLLAVTLMFGETSVLGFQSNLAATLIGTPLLLSSLLYLLFGNIPYVGDAIGYVVARTADFMLDLASSLGAREDAYISLSSRGAWIAVCIFSAVLLVLLLVKVKHRKLLLTVPAVLYPLVICMIASLAASSFSRETELTIFSTGRDEVILAVLEGDAAIIDISDGSLSRLTEASEHAHENGITEFDTLVLTHYHTKHISSVSRFKDSEMLRRVILPYPQTENDAWIMAQLIDLLQASNITCEIALPGAEMPLLHEACITLSELSRLKRSNHPVFFLTLSYDDKLLTYITGSAWEDEALLGTELESALSHSGIIVFGAHGPVVKAPFDYMLDTAVTKECIIIEDGDLKYLLGVLHDNSVDIDFRLGCGRYRIVGSSIVD